MFVTITNLGLSMMTLLMVLLLLVLLDPLKVVGVVLVLNLLLQVDLLLAKRWLFKSQTLVMIWVKMVRRKIILIYLCLVVVLVCSMAVNLNGMLLLKVGVLDMVVSGLLINVSNFLLLFNLVVTGDMDGSRVLITQT
jgi:hypothetical protein